jgi:hypothetical protein
MEKKRVICFMYPMLLGRLMFAMEMFKYFTCSKVKSIEIGAFVFDKHKYHIWWLHGCA